MNSDLFKLWVWNRALPIFQKVQNQNIEQDLLLIEGLADLERILEKSPHPLIVIEYKEYLLAEEILDLHLDIEVDVDLHQGHSYIQILYGSEE